MQAQRKPASTPPIQTLPQGTRREQRGQVIQWRAAAIARRAAPVPAQPLPAQSVSDRAFDVCFVLVGIGAVMVLFLFQRGLL